MFEHWDSFYLLLGGAAGALIGLMFVVATLTSRLDTEKAARGASIYMTPVVFHFAAVLVMSAVATVPQAPRPFLAGAVGLAALIGLGAALRVAVLLRTGRVMRPAHWTDFWWYGAGPVAAYVALGLAAAAIARDALHAAGFFGAALVGLLLLSIRNAWDLVIWVAPRAEAPEQL